MEAHNRQAKFFFLFLISYLVIVKFFFLFLNNLQEKNAL